MIYEVTIGESATLVRDKWLIQATSLLDSVKKSEKKRSRSKELYRGWVITSVREVGELER